MNGCDFRMSFGEEITEHHFGLATGIICPEGQHATVKLYTGEAHTAENEFCQVVILESGEAYGGLEAVDTTEGTVAVSGTVEKLAVETKAGADTSVLCATGEESESAQLHVNMLLSGKDAAGEPTTLGIVNSGGKGRLEWDVYAYGRMTLLGEEKAESLLSAFGLKLKCPNATYVGHEIGTNEGVASGASEATLTPTFGECTLAGFPATVDTNGCDYVVDLGETSGEGEYGATLLIDCPKESSITITAFTSASPIRRKAGSAVFR